MAAEFCACGKLREPYGIHPDILYCEHCDRPCNYGRDCERCKAYSAAVK